MNTGTTHSICESAEESYRLRLCKRICLGREREYLLSCNGRDGTTFCISVKEGEEEAMEEIVCSFANAATIFDRIVRGETAPYVLGEILEDFLHEIE